MAGSLELLLNFLIPGVTLGLAADSTSAHSSNGPFFVCSLWQIHGLVLFELRPKAKHMGNAPPPVPPPQLWAYLAYQFWTPRSENDHLQLPQNTDLLSNLGSHRHF